MNFYYCSSCNKRIELKYKKSHLKSELHLNNEKTVINNYTTMNQDLCQINNILKNNVNNYNKGFKFFEIVGKWNLVFDKDNSIDVKSKVMYRISALSHNPEKYSKNKINHYKRQGLKISHISEVNNSFTTRLDYMTYKPYLEQSMPMVESLFNKKFYKNYDLIKTLDDIDLTLHMGLMKLESRHTLLTTNDDKPICFLDVSCLFTFFFLSNLSHTLQILVSSFIYTLTKMTKISQFYEMYMENDKDMFKFFIEFLSSIT